MAQEIALAASGNHIEIQLRSDAVTPYVYLNSGKIQGKFSDNGFLLLPGEERKLRFSTLGSDSALPDLEEFLHNFYVCSLRDSYI